MSDEIEQIYGFTYTDYEGKEYSTEIKTPGATWKECLNDYIRFLETIYQYDIMSKVRLKDDVFRRNLLERYPYDFVDPWQGEYFVDEQDEEDADISDS